MITCQHCGTSNPSTSIVCQTCGQVLADEAPTQRPVTTTTAATADTEDAFPLPDWLRDIDLPSPAPSAVVESPAPTQNGSTNDLPDWLLADTPAVEATARGPEMEERPAPALDDLPDWLRVPPSATASAPATAPADTQGDYELPAWLRDTASVNNQPPSSDGGSEELPSWLHAASEGQDQSPSLQQEGEDLPTWLRAVASGEDEAATNGGGSDELPAWLQEVTSSPSTDLRDGTGQDEYALPDWLRDSGPVAGATPARQVSPPEELPSWLQDERGGDTQLPTVETQPQAESAAELPPWLQEVDIPTVPTAASDTSPDTLPSWLLEGDQPAPTNGAGTEDATLPPWLDEIAAAAPAPAADTSSNALPSWLIEPTTSPASDGENGGFFAATDREAGPEQGIAQTIELAGDGGGWGQNPTSGDTVAFDEVARGQNSTGADAELPYWLRDEPPATTMDSASPPVADELSATDIPEWLRADEAPAQATSGSAATASMPAWLDEPAPSEAEPATALAAMQPDEEGARVYDAPPPKPATDQAATLPPWLIDADEASGPATSGGLPTWLQETPVAEPSAPGNDFFGNLDLPAWMHDTSPPAAGEQAAVPTYLEVPASEAEVEPAVAPLITPAQPTITRSAERLDAIALLERLRSTPVVEPVRVAPPVRRSWVVPALQVLAVVVIIAALLLALLGPRLPLNLGYAPQPRPGAAAVAQRLQALPSDRPVLVAYEWDARRAAELRPLATTVLAQLTARQLPLIFVSTDPQGSLLMETDVRGVSVANAAYAAGSAGLVNLGFKPGGIIALAGLSQRFGGLFAVDARGQDLRADTAVITRMCGNSGGDANRCRLEQLGMIMVLGDEQSDVQGWVEQVHAAAPAVPMLFAVPSEVGPQVRPYLTDDQALALIGLPDALQLGGTNDALARQWDATTLGAAVFGVLVLFGSVPAALRGRRARKRGARDVWDR